MVVCEILACAPVVWKYLIRPLQQAAAVDKLKIVLQKPVYRRYEDHKQSRASTVQARSMASSDPHSSWRQSSEPAATPTLEVRGRVAFACSSMGFKFVPRGDILFCKVSFGLNFPPTAAPLLTLQPPLHARPRFACYPHAPPPTVSASCFVLRCPHLAELIGPSVKLGFDLICCGA